MLVPNRQNLRTRYHNERILILKKIQYVRRAQMQKFYKLHYKMWDLMFMVVKVCDVFFWTVMLCSLASSYQHSSKILATTYNLQHKIYVFMMCSCLQFPVYNRGSEHPSCSPAKIWTMYLNIQDRSVPVIFVFTVCFKISKLQEKIGTENT